MYNRPRIDGIMEKRRGLGNRTRGFKKGRSRARVGGRSATHRAGCEERDVAEGWGQLERTGTNRRHRIPAYRTLSRLHTQYSNLTTLIRRQVTDEASNGIGAVDAISNTRTPRSAIPLPILTACAFPNKYPIWTMASIIVLVMYPPKSVHPGWALTRSPYERHRHGHPSMNATPRSQWQTLYSEFGKAMHWW